MPKKSAPPNPFVPALLQAFQSLADPERAVQQQRYARSALPFAGLSMPVLRRTCRELMKAHPCQDQADWLATAQYLWDNAEVREARYAAIELLARPRYQKAWLDLHCLTLLEHMIRDGAWWDLVDALATNHIGVLLRHHPEAMGKLLRQWLRDDDLWIRRTAILAQLKFKNDTDLELLDQAIQHSIHDSNFFARKAIGWALREYSKTDAEWVRAYVAQHAEALSPLSVREALKVLNKRG